MTKSLLIIYYRELIKTNKSASRIHKEPLFSHSHRPLYMYLTVGIRCVHGPLKDNHVITKNKHKVCPSGRYINRKLKYNPAGWLVGWSSSVRSVNHRGKWAFSGRSRELFGNGTTRNGTSPNTLKRTSSSWKKTKPRGTSNTKWNVCTMN